MPRSHLLSVLAIAAATMPALSSQTLAQAQTGTGGGPTSTITAPNTSRVGQTMPPASGNGAVSADERRIRARTPNEKQDDQIMRGICIGCSKQ